jgi:hypothetical protein
MGLWVVEPVGSLRQVDERAFLRQGDFFFFFFVQSSDPSALTPCPSIRHSPPVSYFVLLAARPLRAAVAEERRLSLAPLTSSPAAVDGLSC